MLLVKRVPRRTGPREKGTGDAHVALEGYT
jgi:hypothetical protein